LSGRGVKIGERAPFSPFGISGMSFGGKNMRSSEKKEETGPKTGSAI
jgi:hypothetical protein